MEILIQSIEAIAWTEGEVGIAHGLSEYSTSQHSEQKDKFPSIWGILQPTAIKCLNFSAKSELVWSTERISVEFTTFWIGQLEEQSYALNGEDIHK